jgi:hypothetical protein
MVVTLGSWALLATRPCTLLLCGGCVRFHCRARSNSSVLACVQHTICPLWCTAGARLCGEAGLCEAVGSAHGSADVVVLGPGRGRGRESVWWCGGSGVVPATGCMRADGSMRMCFCWCTLWRSAPPGWWRQGTSSARQHTLAWYQHRCRAHAGLSSLQPPFGGTSTHASAAAATSPPPRPALCVVPCTCVLLRRLRHTCLCTAVARRRAAAGCASRGVHASVLGAAVPQVHASQSVQSSSCLAMRHARACCRLPLPGVSVVRPGGGGGGRGRGGACCSLRCRGRSPPKTHAHCRCVAHRQRRHACIGLHARELCSASYRTHSLCCESRAGVVVVVVCVCVCVGGGSRAGASLLRLLLVQAAALSGVCPWSWGVGRCLPDGQALKRVCVGGRACIASCIVCAWLTRPIWMSRKLAC